MSKSDQKAAKNQANANIAANTANMQATNTELQDILGTSKTTAASVLPGAVSGYSDISTTGGYDPSIMGSITSGYQNLIDTGGISPADVTAMQDRASEAAKSSYDIAAANTKRIAAATGGYGSTAALESNLARTGSQAAEQAVVDTNATIAGLKQSGTIAGLTGQTQLQQNIAGNKLAATGGLANIYGMSEAEVNHTVDSILQNYQQTGQLNNQDLSILTNLANQPGVFDKIVGTIGTLGGAAAGVIGAVKG